MAHETKLGLAFIGILLTVFSALLIKKMTKHGSLPPMNLNATAAKQTETGSLSRLPLQPSPPTLVKPLSENTKPPELSANNRDTAKLNDTAKSNDAKQSDEPTWNSSKLKPVKTDATVTNSAPPPAVLAE